MNYIGETKMLFEKELLADWSSTFSMLSVFGGGLEFYIGSIQNPADAALLTKAFTGTLTVDDLR